MGLPKLDHPTFELTIPSTQETVKYRPFLVKEEKILLMAQESGEPNVFIGAISQVLNNCVIDYDVKNLTSFDTEYFHLWNKINLPLLPSDQYKEYLKSKQYNYQDKSLNLVERYIFLALSGRNFQFL